jgi:hypothetical protein
MSIFWVGRARDLAIAADGQLWFVDDTAAVRLRFRGRQAGS